MMLQSLVKCDNKTVYHPANFLAYIAVVSLLQESNHEYPSLILVTIKQCIFHRLFGQRVQCSFVSASVHFIDRVLSIGTLASTQRPSSAK